jgi:hypothetical protein
MTTHASLMLTCADLCKVFSHSHQFLLRLQVFPLVLPYVQDIGSLLICSTLSQKSQQMVQDEVQLKFASLVCQLPDAGKERLDRLGDIAWRVNTEEQQLGWLCSVAGPACVNTHGNTCAILWTLDNMPKTDYAYSGEQQQYFCLAECCLPCTTATQHINCCNKHQLPVHKVHADY